MWCDVTGRWKRMKLITVYAGLYSFFNNYSTTCSDQGNGEICQSRILSVEGKSNIYAYGTFFSRPPTKKKKKKNKKKKKRWL
jgi:hypothetical protein